MGLGRLATYQEIMQAHGIRIRIRGGGGHGVHRPQGCSLQAGLGRIGAKGRSNQPILHFLDLYLYRRTNFCPIIRVSVSPNLPLPNRAIKSSVTPSWHFIVQPFTAVLLLFCRDGWCFRMNENGNAACGLIKKWKSFFQK